MKKNLFFLFALICSVSLFTACSDDDDNKGGDENLISGPMVGTWQLADVVKDDMDSFVFGPVNLVWEAPEGTMLGFLPVKDVPPMANSLGSAMLIQVVKDITLGADGNILATYSEKAPSMGSEPVVPEWKESEVGYATWKKVDDSKILVFLNLEKIMGAKTREDNNPLLAVLEIVKNGIPVNIRYDEQQNPTFFVDKALTDKLVPLIPQLVGLIPDDGLNGMAPLVKMMLNAVPDAMKVTTKFEVGLNMKK